MSDEATPATPAPEPTIEQLTTLLSEFETTVQSLETEVVSLKNFIAPFMALITTKAVPLFQRAAAVLLEVKNIRA